VLGHPVHPVLVAFPLGLLLTGLLFDLWGWWSANVFWSDLAFYLIVAGVAGGLLAAPFGLVDWLAIPRGTRAKVIGAWHGGGNVLALVLFALSAFLRAGRPGALGGSPLLFAFLGAAVLLFTGWLGGELVVRLAIGVDPNAHVDAPNSLSHEQVPEAHSPESHVVRHH
jgi:uncharacterized membrane protein